MFSQAPSESWTSGWVFARHWVEFWGNGPPLCQRSRLHGATLLFAVTETRLRGRFAPSPTGPLHFGSLVAAVASYLDAKSAGAEWLVRMEDVDTPRSVPCAAESILRSLEAHGMEWDGPVVAQSQRLNLYREALRQLGDRVYPCGCSRRNVAGAYPGTCRAGLATNRRASAFRLREIGRAHV